jgi:hypothetical protein
MNLYLILPAIIGFSFGGIILFYFFRKQEPKGIILSSFFFIFSGFLFQIIFTSEFDYLKYFASDYKDVFSIPIFTILATATGIFLGNMGLRFLANNKEKREISILFINAINSQFRSLGVINSYLISYKKKDIQNYIEIYRNRLKDNKFYETAFNKVGIYNEQEIDFISKYSVEFQEYLSYLERLLIEVNQDKQEQEILINVEESTIQYQQPYEKTFIIVKIAHIITMLFACLVVYKLSISYLSKNYKEVEEEFIRDYKLLVYEDLISLFQYKKFYKISKTLSNDLFNKLRYIRKVFKQNSILSNKINSEKPLYMCLISVKESFIIPTSSQIREETKFRFHYIIDSKDNIVAFNHSQDEAIKNCQNLLKNLIEEYKDDPQATNVEEYIKDCKIKCDIVSPWGENE